MLFRLSLAPLLFMDIYDESQSGVVSCSSMRCIENHKPAPIVVHQGASAVEGKRDELLSNSVTGESPVYTHLSDVQGGEPASKRVDEALGTRESNFAQREGYVCGQYAAYVGQIGRREAALLLLPSVLQQEIVLVLLPTIETLSHRPIEPVKRQFVIGTVL